MLSLRCSRTDRMPRRPWTQLLIRRSWRSTRAAMRSRVCALRRWLATTLLVCWSCLWKALLPSMAMAKPPEFCVQVQGTSRELAPLVRDDVYKIASEALRNAFLHAHAARIEVEIQYDPRQLRLRVRDNGKGIDPTVLEAGAREGHYGLPGMRERAKLVGGKLAVWSELDSGTETELSIPASIAYAKSQGARRPMFWKRGA